MYKVYAAVGAALALAAGPALAQDRDTGRAGDNDNVEGLYLGAGMGDFSSQIDDLDDVDDVNIDFDEDENASRIFAGWRFNRFFAVQADYYDFGESDSALGLLPLTTDTDGFAPSIVGTLPIGPIELFARAGVLWYDLQVSLDDDDIIDESGSDAVYSAGIGFTVLERLNLKAEWEVVDINEFDDADAVWLSANWRF